MKDKQTQMWIPLYVDKWIFGSTRIELEPAERGVFVDLLAFGAKDQGYIRANESTAYPHTQLAGLLNIPVELLDSAIAKCLHFNKLEEPTPGIYKLTNWDNYQFTRQYIHEVNTKGIPSLHNCKVNLTDCKAIRKDRIVKEKKETTKRVAFAPPTLEQVRAYCTERGGVVNPGKWMAHYEANGWRVGKNPMKDWKAAIRTWEHNDFGDKPIIPAKPINRVNDSPAACNPWETDPDGILKGGKL